MLCLLGALLGGTLLGAAAAQRHPLWSASGLYGLALDPVVPGQEQANELDVDDFVEAQLVVITGVPLRREVEDLVGADVDLDAVQVGSAPIVEITAVARRRADAVEAADKAAAIYAGDRRQAALARLQAVRTRVQQQLTQAASALQELDSADAGVPLDVQRGALAEEYTRLVELRSQLRVAEASSSRLVQVLRQPVAEDAEQQVSIARDVLLGLLLGAVVGLGLGLVLDRLRRRVVDEDDVLDLVEPALVLPPARLPRRAGDLEGAASALALHVSALSAADGTFASRPVVVVGPAASAGAGAVARALALAAARRGPTLLVVADPLPAEDPLVRDRSGRAHEHPDGPYAAAVAPSAVAGLSLLSLADLASSTGELERLAAGHLLDDLARSGGQVVVDAPPLSEGSAGLDLARDAGRVLLVVGAGRTSPSELDQALRSLQRAGAALAGVVLGPGGPRGRSARRRAARRAPMTLERGPVEPEHAAAVRPS